MIDFISGYAPLLVERIQAERHLEAHRRRWLRELSEIRRRERAAAPRERAVVVNRPKHLAGVHKL